MLRETTKIDHRCIYSLRDNSASSDVHASEIWISLDRSRRRREKLVKLDQRSIYTRTPFPAGPASALRIYMTRSDPYALLSSSTTSYFCPAKYDDWASPTLSWANSRGPHGWGYRSTVRVYTSNIGYWRTRKEGMEQVRVHGDVGMKKRKN